jgi:hypothetical protein
MRNGSAGSERYPVISEVSCLAAFCIPRLADVDNGHMHDVNQKDILALNRRSRGPFACEVILPKVDDEILVAGLENETSLKALSESAWIVNLDPFVNRELPSQRQVLIEVGGAAKPVRESTRRVPVSEGRRVPESGHVQVSSRGPPNEVSAAITGGLHRTAETRSVRSVAIAGVGKRAGTGDRAQSRARVPGVIPDNCQPLTMEETIRLLFDR